MPKGFSFRREVAVRSKTERRRGKNEFTGGGVGEYTGGGRGGGGRRRAVYRAGGAPLVCIGSHTNQINTG